VSQQEK